MFIYVFSEHDKAKLISEGFSMLKEDKTNTMFVFVIDSVPAECVAKRFSTLEKYCISDVLTF